MASAAAPRMGVAIYAARTTPTRPLQSNFAPDALTAFPHFCNSALILLAAIPGGLATVMA